MSARSIRERGSSNSRNTEPVRSRNCAGNCGGEIPAKRLAVMPNATLCVDCLEAAGDVPVVRRFDEFMPDGERVETVFVRNRHIEGAIKRAAHTAAPDDAFYIDDERITPADNQELIAHQALTSSLEELTEYEMPISADSLEQRKAFAIRRLRRGKAVPGDAAMIAYLEPDTAVSLGIHFQRAA